MAPAPRYEEPFSLNPIDFDSKAECDELLVQRKLCGWRFSQEDIDHWRDMVQRGAKHFFWITLPSRDSVRAGHVALASEAEPPHADLAKPDKSVLTISNFFVMPGYRSLGLGRLTMDRLEDWATKEPYGSVNCKAMAVDTVARRFVEDDELREMFSIAGVPAPEKGSSTEDWYTRRGYVKFSEYITRQLWGMHC